MVSGKKPQIRKFLYLSRLRPFFTSFNVIFWDLRIDAKTKSFERKNIALYLVNWFSYLNHTDKFHKVFMPGKMGEKIHRPIRVHNLGV